MIYTIKQFIKSGVHLGHYKWECDYRLSYFLLGLRNSIHIINLYYTLFILKKALYIAYNMCILNQKLLVVNNASYKLDLNFNKINQKRLWFINNKWKGGLLSNQKEIFFNNEKLYLQHYDLGYNALLPAYVFSSNIKNTSSCIFESILLNIPCSALIDSNIGFYGIFYGIPSNDDNFVSIYLFTRLFIKIYFKSIYDNINSLKINSKLNKKDLLLNNEIRYKLRYDRQLKYKFWLRKRLFSKNKTWKNFIWGNIWLKRRNVKNKLMLKWQKCKKLKFFMKKKINKKINKKFNKKFNKKN